MKKCELYYDANDILCLDFFINEHFKKPYVSTKGNEARRQLRKLLKKDLIEVSEMNEDTFCMIFNNAILNIEDSDNFDNSGAGYIICEKIKKFKENPPASKKVERTKKYSGKQILAAGLCTAILATTASVTITAQNNAKQNVEDPVPFTTTTVTITAPTKEEVSKLIVTEKAPAEEVTTTTATTPTTTQGTPLEQTTSLSFEDKTQSDKLQGVEENYSYLIDKYSKKYGLDPALVSAIAAQERGVHSTEIDEGGAIGLMQVQVSVWQPTEEVPEPSVTAYNFETNELERIQVFPDKLSDLEYNIETGCRILQECLRYTNYNIPAAIQCYNMGIGTLRNYIYPVYEAETGMDEEYINSNPDDTTWMDYRVCAPWGDPEYVEHISSYIDSDCEIRIKTPDGDIINWNVNNLQKSKAF